MPPHTFVCPSTTFGSSEYMTYLTFRNYCSFAVYYLMWDCFLIAEPISDTESTERPTKRLKKRRQPKAARTTGHPDHQYPEWDHCHCRQVIWVCFFQNQLWSITVFYFNLHCTYPKTVKSNWLDFIDFKHDYIEEVYWSDMCFAGLGPRTVEFHGDCLSECPFWEHPDN